jgi:hypothetical protein
MFLLLVLGGLLFVRSGNLSRRGGGLRSDVRLIFLLIFVLLGSVPVCKRRRLVGGQRAGCNLKKKKKRGKRKTKHCKSRDRRTERRRRAGGT